MLQNHLQILNFYLFLVTIHSTTFSAGQQHQATESQEKATNTLQCTVLLSCAAWWVR
jgi:hypothetical protein